ncbi:hypothetical protein [Halosimplex salinum]|uniref:hypothetical protein n=1 Tax=Halosimplex salinum TaxID=1710538 RepID=UPI000F4AE845|nr:hypothetical protein [Halosimplex salinum]
MDIRDAVEADADRLAELTGSPQDVMRNLVHDRTVRVATDDEEITGFVSYDAQSETVHITQLEGTPAVRDRLLEEPIRFAESEGMAVELLVPEDEGETRDAAEDAGFEHTGAGPTFEGQPTVRYRLELRAE